MRIYVAWISSPVLLMSSCSLEFSLAVHTYSSLCTYIWKYSPITSQLYIGSYSLSEWEKPTFCHLTHTRVGQSYNRQPGLRTASGFKLELIFETSTMRFREESCFHSKSFSIERDRPNLCRYEWTLCRLRAIVWPPYNVWAAVWAECTKEARLNVRIDVGVIKGGNARRNVLISQMQLNQWNIFVLKYHASLIQMQNFLLIHRANFRNKIVDQVIHILLRWKLH